LATPLRPLRPRALAGTFNYHDHDDIKRVLKQGRASSSRMRPCKQRLKTTVPELGLGYFLPANKCGDDDGIKRWTDGISWYARSARRPPLRRRVGRRCGRTPRARPGCYSAVLHY